MVLNGRRGWISSLLLTLVLFEISLAQHNGSPGALAATGPLPAGAAGAAGSPGPPGRRKKRGVLNNFYAAIPPQPQGYGPPSNPPPQPTPVPDSYHKTVHKNAYGPPAENLTRTQIAFAPINRDARAFAEYISQPQIQRFPELRNGLIVNLDGRPITCEDICSRPRVIFGLVGLCTRDYCVCNPDLDSGAGNGQGGQNGIGGQTGEGWRSGNGIGNGNDIGYEPQRHAREQRCPEGQVYDGVTLTCKDPRNTIMCDDHHSALPPLAQGPSQGQSISQSSGSGQIVHSGAVQTVSHGGHVKEIHDFSQLQLVQHPQTSGQTVVYQPVAQTVGVSSIPAPVISYNHKATLETVGKYEKYHPTVLLSNVAVAAEANQSPVHQVYVHQQ